MASLSNQSRKFHSGTMGEKYQLMDLHQRLAVSSFMNISGIFVITNNFLFVKFKAVDFMNVPIAMYRQCVARLQLTSLKSKYSSNTAQSMSFMDVSGKRYEKRLLVKLAVGQTAHDHIIAKCFTLQSSQLTTF